jgi:hypothetical protein
LLIYRQYIVGNEKVKRCLVVIFAGTFIAC